VTELSPNECRQLAQSIPATRSRAPWSVLRKIAHTRTSTICNPGEPIYDLPYHKENDETVLRGFIREHPFAFVTACDANGRPVAAQIPVFLEERDGHEFLSDHLMKDTDHHRAFAGNQNVLVMFTSRHTYVSGSWYSDPHTPSTWPLRGGQAEE